MANKNKTTKNQFKAGIFTFIWGNNAWDAGAHGVRGQMIDSTCQRHEVMTTPTIQGAPHVVRKKLLSDMPLVERHQARRMDSIDACLPQLCYVVPTVHITMVHELLEVDSCGDTFTSESKKMNKRYMQSGYTLVPVTEVPRDKRCNMPSTGIVGIPPKGAVECAINTFQEWTHLQNSGFEGLALGSWKRPDARRKPRVMDTIGDHFPSELLVNV